MSQCEGTPSCLTLRISDARREEIFAARERLGGVKVRPSRLSHVIFSPISDQLPQSYIDRNVMSPSYHVFEQELKKQGFELRVETVAEADVCNQIKDYIGSSKHPDGMLIRTSYCTPELAQMLKRYAYPHVSNDFTREHLEINTVCHHATAGMRQVVEHLAKLGHRRLAFMGPEAFYRYPMMASAMITLNLPVDPAVNCWLKPIRYPQNFDDIRILAAEAFDDWHRKHPYVTGLVCSNDHVALGVIDAMRRSGLKPGKDLSVVGYDDIEGDDAVLTTVRNPVERIGRRMAELLLNQILHGQTAIIHERVPVSLMVRQTTGFPHSISKNSFS